MNSKIVFPWILAAAFFAAICFLFANGKNKEKEIAQLRRENSELPNLRAELAQAKKGSEISGDTIADKERVELVRLRNEVGTLRREKQELTAQAQKAQRDTEQFLQKRESAEVQKAEQFARESQEQKNVRAREICINNLRQIDGAKQQWALENKQPADAQVVMQQLLPYFKDSAAPVCPSGGVYMVNSVDAAPTCSIAGHTLAE